MSATWHNWADTLDVVVIELDDPTTLADLKAAVTKAAQAGRKVRVVGSGHSWSYGAVPGTAPYSPGAQTNANLIDCSNMNPVNTSQDDYLKATYFQDGDTHLVAVPPGTTQGWLATNAANASNDTIVPAPYRGYDPDHLYSNEHPDLAPQSAGPAPDITLGGFIANGCHGTGWENPTVADLVQAIEVVVWDGSQAVTKSYAVSESVQAACVAASVFDSQPTVDAGAISAMRCSLGALGAISKMVLRLIPAFNVAHINEYVDNDTLFNADYLEQVVTSTDYVEVFWFPYNTQSWLMRYSQARPPNTEPENTGLLNAFTLINSVMASVTGGKLGDFFKAVPWLTPITMQTIWGLMKHFPGMRELKDPDFWTDFDAGDKKVVAPLWQAYLYQLKYFTNLLDVSYTVPIVKTAGGYDFSKVIDAWNQALAQLDKMKKRLKYPLNINLHIRFIKNSQALLSPAVWPEETTHTCYIEFLSFSQVEDVYQEYANVVGQDWFGLGGLPHWAKAFQFVDDSTPTAHARLGERGALSPFLAQRSTDDPEGVYLNDFLCQLLEGQACSTGQDEAVAQAKAGAKAATLAAAGPLRPAKSFAFAPDAWKTVWKRLASGGVTREGAGSLEVHLDGNGALVDLHHQVHPLKVTYDEESKRVVFTLLSDSRFLSPKELFDAIGFLLRAAAAE